MSCAEIHVDDIGTIFTVTIVDQDDAVVDISLYSPKQLIFTKPDGTRVEQTASFTTDGTDGKIQYTSESGDLDQPGLWQLQGIVSTLHTNITTFPVHRNL